MDVGAAGSVQRGPDGTPWPVLHITTPLAQFALFMPPEAADSMADQLPGLLRELATKARRDASGLVIATHIDFPGGKKP